MAKLTADEFAALHRTYNIADAHARATPSEFERQRVISALPNIFDEALRLSIRDADVRGAAAFAQLSRQTTMKPEQALPVYASSTAIEIVAHALRSAHRRVTMIAPTFDNIPDIMKRNSVPLRPIQLNSQTPYLSSLIAGLRDSRPGDTLFIVTPNNPTGQILGEDDFTALCQMCGTRGVDLIVDASFRLFDEASCFDHYQILDDYGVGYICIEDTGKCWTSLDVKLAYICCSDSWRPLIKDVYNDFLLNVSPFISLVVEAYSQLYLERGLDELRRRISENRGFLRNLVAHSATSVTLPFMASSVSVELLELPRAVAASEVVNACKLREVSVLSGEAFYWHNRALGGNMLRVALFRDPDIFEVASRLMFEAIDSEKMLLWITGPDLLILRNSSERVLSIKVIRGMRTHARSLTAILTGAPTRSHIVAMSMR